MTLDLVGKPRGASVAENIIHFEYDAEHDVHLAYPVWHVVTEADCKAWYEQYAAYFVPLGSKVDAIFVSHMFSLEPSIGEVWNRYRERLNSTFVRHSVRVFLGTQTRFIKAGVYSDWATDIESAMAMLEEKRRG